MPDAANAPAPPARAEVQRREDWRASDHELDEVELHFELDARRTCVRSTLAIRRRAHAAEDAPLVLDGRGLRPVALEIDGAPVESSRVEQGERTLTIRGVPERFTLRVVTELEPQHNLSGRGLFVLDGTLVTQMEPEGLSRVTFFPDRPDVLARYRVTLVADRARYPVLLCNGNLVASRELGDGRHEAVWDDPFRKPSYVFGLVAGDLASLRGSFRTASGRDIRLAVHAPARHVERCRFALQALTRAMRWDEATYGLECDVDDFQIVALSGFPGAMENKGLNLFDLAGVVADPEITTDDEALTIERIIAHEYFHNWTGNRVTCRDWFQLSLKEGLTRFRDQCYIDDLLGPGVYRIDVVRNLLRNQFPEDDGPNRHPIRPERYADVEELYTATVYEKGAEVIRMLQTLLGPRRFVDCVREYLRVHDGRAVTTDDFVDVLARNSGQDLEAFRRWYTQAGRPRLVVERRPVAGGVELVLAQRWPEGLPAAAPVTIPVRLSWLDRQGRALSPARADGGDPGLIELNSARRGVTFRGLTADAVASVLEGFSAPVSLEPYLSREERLVVLAHGRDPWARWNAAQGLVIEAIRTHAEALRAGRQAGVDEELIATLGELLAHRGADPAGWLLTAELLRVPDEPVLSEGLPAIDVDGHHRARNALRAGLGRALREPLLAVLAEPGRDDRELMNVPGMGRRRLAGVCIDLLAATGDDEVARLCHDRALAAPTMTERFDALAAIVDIDHPLRQQALDAFVERWRDHPTVVNKWFMAQALARSPGALDRIMALQAHPLFRPTDIAQGMAFFGSFFRQNRVTFHHASGRGYEWLADMLLALDRLGRPGGVWLTPQISQWRRHAPPRQALMRGALLRVASTPGLSNGLRGLVERLLGD